MLLESGIPQEKLERFDVSYEEIIGENEVLVAANITNTKKFSIESPDITIRVNPSRTDLIETRMIDGIQCLVIAMTDHIEVNGVPIRTIPLTEV